MAIASSASVRITKGEPYGRTLNTTGLTQGSVTLTVEPQGTFFYPTVKLVDLRFVQERAASARQAGRAVRRVQRHQLAGDSQREQPDRRDLRQRADDGQPADRQAGRALVVLAEVRGRRLGTGAGGWGSRSYAR